MSLDTILQIGKVLRHESKDPLRHYRYVSSIDKTDLIGIVIPVKEDFSFDINNIRIMYENEKDKIYYLKYRTSDSDTSPTKYVFGDIYYKVDKKGEKGNFIIKKSNAYNNAKSIRKSYIETYVNNNSNSKKNNRCIISEIERYIDNVELNNNDNNLFINNDKLLLFWKNFAYNKHIIEQILSYAPILLESIDFNNMSERYIKYLLTHCKEECKHIIDKDSTFDNLDDKQKDKLKKYGNHSVFIHFNFFQNKNWYDIKDVFINIENDLNSKLVRKQNGEMLSPAAFIYRTLCSGDKSNDIQYPSFDINNSYKSFAFKNVEDFKDFLYTSSIISQPRFWLKGTSINIYVLPVAIYGQKIEASDYESFFFDNKNEDNLFELNFLDDDNQKFIRFDFVFSDTSGKTVRDLIELSGLDKSKLEIIRERIRNKEELISKEKAITNDSDNVNMSLEKSFSNIFGIIKTKKNDLIIDNTCHYYQSHMMKVLPLIYAENYYHDKSILSNLINKVEFFIRNNDKELKYNRIFFNDLKYDMQLIMSIQNNKISKYMEIISSDSYAIGQLLGKLAKNLREEINPFEKNYVGNLTRRIVSISDFIKLKNDIEQKLIMHDKTKFTYQISYDLSQKLKEFKSQYDKEECAFGFFDSYFEPLKKKEDSNNE